jgi:hypothetical protein
MPLLRLAQSMHVARDAVSAEINAC